MRKIDKSKILSKNYSDWLKCLEKNNHPPYNSSNNKYYNDIKMSLLHCQQGLCAYTEEVLCNPKFIDSNNWDTEKYILALEKLDKNEIKGDLEHFDESLKEHNSWLWDNLFIVDTHANCRVKGRKSVKKILKPDAIDYDENKYLEFDEETGIFIANHLLTKEEKIDVTYMIETLGLNCISYQRKKQLQEWKDRYENGLDVDAYRYMTAWSMVLKNLEN